MLVKFQERLSIYIGTADQQSIKQDTKKSAQKSKQSQWVSQDQSVVNKDDIIDRSNVRDWKRSLDPP